MGETGVRPSVVYRTGPITAEDYDEAIEALTLARKQLVEDFTYCCLVCEADDHTALRCHHNPLVLARLYGKMPGAVHLNAAAPWRCFHCGETFDTDEAAAEHFGDSEQEVARCLADQAGAPPEPGA